MRLEYESVWNMEYVSENYENVPIFNDQKSYIIFTQTQMHMPKLYCYLLAHDTITTQAACYILEGVGVLNSNGKDKLVLLFDKTTVQLWQVNQT